MPVWYYVYICQFGTFVWNRDRVQSTRAYRGWRNEDSTPVFQGGHKYSVFIIRSTSNTRKWSLSITLQANFLPSTNRSHTLRAIETPCAFCRNNWATSRVRLQLVDILNVYSNPSYQHPAIYSLPGAAPIEVISYERMNVLLMDPASSHKIIQDQTWIRNVIAYSWHSQFMVANWREQS